ncbi:MAG: NADH-quinone oxidoreductase subunit A [candidate division KSB1 bacterium]|nr:NADH-quinone oxidoreductase subunit A [candidate division KSB1 bacterium]MDQ7063227.1 NADH-quinone oxidoreductase subunit A [candidate division KSB1 bacterium]
MLLHFAAPFIFVIVAAAFIALNLLISRLLQPRVPSAGKNTTYECGEIPIGSSWVQFNIRFYVITLIFVIFDVEIVFLVPWAVVFKDLGWFAFVEVVIFVFILLVGLAYAWRKGDLEWDKPETGKFARDAAPQLFEEVGTERQQTVQEVTL